MKKNRPGSRPCDGLLFCCPSQLGRKELYGKLDLEIRLKAPFRDHLDTFENGEQTDCLLSSDFDYDRLGAIIYGEYCAG